jgi:hypothetical protein
MQHILCGQESLSPTPNNALSCSYPQIPTTSGASVNTRMESLCAHNDAHYVDITIHIALRGRRARRIRRLRA